MNDGDVSLFVRMNMMRYTWIYVQFTMNIIPTPETNYAYYVIVLQY